MTRVACIGDSITWGFTLLNPWKQAYPALLQEKLGSGFEVRNFGYNDACVRFDGDTPYVRKKVYRESLAWQPDIVLLMLGSNDTKLRNWDPEVFRRDYRRIVQAYRDLSPAPRVILIAPIRVHLVLGKPLLGLHPELMEEGVRPAIREIAAETGLPLVDLVDLFPDARYCRDGVHPQATGARMLSEAVFSAIDWQLPPHDRMIPEDMKIVFLDAASLGETPLDEIAALGELVTWPSSSPEEALERVGDCDVLIVNKVRVTGELLARAPRLKLVCEAATGVNNIDLEACAARGIPVRNAAGYSTDAVVQSTFAHLLSLAGHSPYFDECVKSGRYSAGTLFCDISHPYTELFGKTLGIIGMGAIGTKVAAVATAFGMRVVYYSTSGTSHNRDYPSVPLDTLLKESDAVSIHAPLNGRTAGLIGSRELGMMKPTAFLLNLGRGGIVDEAALARAVDAGTIAGAALDVYVSEPLPADSPLLQVRHPERFRFTPHVAWASREALSRLVRQVAENIRAGWA